MIFKKTKMKVLKMSHKPAFIRFQRVENNDVHMIRNRVTFMY